jgi:hypothetical protein
LLKTEEHHFYYSLVQDFRSASQVYWQKKSAFFSSLPKTIKILEIGKPFTGNTLKELARLDIKPVVLHFFRPSELHLWKLKDVEQLECIRQMTTLKSLTIGIDPRVQEHCLDFVSTAIIKLYIRFENHPFYIDWVMTMFPSLEELCVDCPPYSSTINLVNRDAWKIDKKRIYPKLLVLKAKYSPIDQKLIPFCKLAAPNMMKLDLTIEFPSKGKTIDINLVDWHVKQCHLSLPGFSRFDKVYFIVHITIHDITKRFVFQSMSGSTTLANGLIKPNIERVVNITCSDDQHIVIGGFTLMKMGSKIVVDL